MEAVKILLQIEYAGKDWGLFNSYRYKRMAEADKKAITRFETVILKGTDKRYYLYKELA